MQSSLAKRCDFSRSARKYCLGGALLSGVDIVISKSWYPPVVGDTGAMGPVTYVIEQLPIGAAFPPSWAAYGMIVLP